MTGDDRDAVGRFAVFRKSVQAEVLLSLGLVMITGTALVAAVLFEIDGRRVSALHDLLGRGFVAASSEPAFAIAPPDEGRWWRIDGHGRTTGLNASALEIDPVTRTLALEAIGSGESLVQSGAPWQPIHFAGPDGRAGSAIAGRIEAPVSGFVLALLVATDVLIFGLFGLTLLRRRVVGPLRRLAAGVREIGANEGPAELPVEGVGEIEALGSAFNEMQDALAARTGALEKAVVDLRSTNATLLQAREGLDRAERLAMVGSLAAGVAHEVGNPMAALLAFLEVAGRDEGMSEESRRCLEKAGEQGERVRVILRQLLDFSRPPQVSHGPIDLGALARQAVELVSAQRVYSDIAFEVVVDEDVRAAMGDGSLASQILLNLVVNAAAALDGADDRRVRLDVARAVSTPRSEEDEGDAPEARLDCVRVRVSDSGPGVELEEPERIFDPFFTTKAPGEGTGLGLANARRLAQEMAGDVVLESARSALGGACFAFRLPDASRAPSEESAGVARVRESDAEAAPQSRMP